MEKNSQIEVENRLGDLLSEFVRKSLDAAIVTIHFPNLSADETCNVADCSPTTLCKVIRKMKEAGWRKEGNYGATPTLLSLFKHTDEQLNRVEGIRDGSIIPIRHQRERYRRDKQRQLEKADIIKETKDVLNPFVGYGKYVLNRKKGEVRSRITPLVATRLAELWPQHVISRGRLGGALARCISNMHHEELERFVEYYMDDDKVAQYQFKFRTLESSHPFTPLMIYPNIAPFIADMLILSDEHSRDWHLFETLNNMTHVQQRLWVAPPRKYKNYTIYNNPANQFELAGFHAEQLQSREYLVKKSTTSGQDKRTRLLNCINIIQSRFPNDEAGVQDMKRLTDNIIQICRTGDDEEIDIWHNGFICAPTIPVLRLDDLPANDIHTDSKDRETE